MKHKVPLILLSIICATFTACSGNEFIAPTVTSIPTQTSIAQTQVATKTAIPTLTSAPTTEALATATLGYVPVFPPALREGQVCDAYAPIPPKGWMGYPTDYQPVAYVRALSLDENLWFEPVVVELGVFVKPSELNEIDGKTVYSYDGQTQFMVHSAIYLQDAPDEIQETLKNGTLIASIEIVDLQNNPLPYLINNKSVDDITYAVDDTIPHPVLDLTVPCSGFIDGHAISYASTKLQES